MTDDELPTPPDDALALLLQRTPETERESPESPESPAPLPPAHDAYTDSDFWGFADTFKNVQRLDRLDRLDRSEPLPRRRTPPRIIIPTTLSEVTPLPRMWSPGDKVLVIAAAFAALAIALFVLLYSR